MTTAPHPPPIDPLRHPYSDPAQAACQGSVRFKDSGVCREWRYESPFKGVRQTQLWAELWKRPQAGSSRARLKVVSDEGGNHAE